MSDNPTTMYLYSCRACRREWKQENFFLHETCVYCQSEDCYCIGQEVRSIVGVAEIIGLTQGHTPSTPADEVLGKGWKITAPTEKK